MLAGVWTVVQSTEGYTSLICAALFVLTVAFRRGLRYFANGSRKSEFRDESSPQVQSQDISQRTDYAKFQTNFLLVYLCAFGCDWVTAPYIYAMFSTFHNLDAVVIRNLLCITFCSTAVASCAVAPLVDACGRKKGFIVGMSLWILRYCLVLFGTTYQAFVAAQIAYGIAMAVLYNVPEGWMLFEHRVHRKYPEAWVQETYTKMTMGNAVVSVLASFVCLIMEELSGSIAGSLYIGSILAAVAMFLAAFTWSETTSMPSDDNDGFGTPDEILKERIKVINNVVFDQVKGDSKDRAPQLDESSGRHNGSSCSDSRSVESGGHLGVIEGNTQSRWWGRCGENITAAARLLATSLYGAIFRVEVLTIGVAQSLYETAFWIFVAFWTPSVEGLNLSVVFVGYMICTALGSYVAAAITTTAQQEETVPSASSRVAVLEEQVANPHVAATSQSRALSLRPEASRQPKSLPQSQASPIAAPVVTSLGVVGHSSADSIHKKFPGDNALRGVAVVYQALSGAALLWAAHETVVPRILWAFMLIEAFNGVHTSAFYCLRAKVVPEIGRVVTQSLFSVPTCIISLLVFLNSEAVAPSSLYGIAAKLCFGASAALLVEWFFRVIRKRPSWHPRSPELATDGDGPTSAQMESSLRYYSPLNLFFGPRRGIQTRQEDSRVVEELEVEGDPTLPLFGSDVQTV